MFAENFHFVGIATDEMENGESVFQKLLNDRSGGLPWMTILSADGEEIVSSNGPQGNVGFPVTPPEIKHFVDMIRQSSDANEERLAAIGKALTAKEK